MPRRNEPRRARVYGARVRLNGQVEIAPHPAETPTDTRCRLLELPPGLLNDIYDYVAKQISVIGLTYTSSRCVAIHPLANVCKQIRSEFLGRVERVILPNARSYVAQIKDFNFGPLIHILRRNPLIKNNGNIIVFIKIYHDITATEIHIPHLLRWERYLASHYEIDTRHAVGSMPLHNSRHLFMNRLLKVRSNIPLDSVQLHDIVSTFERWWGAGAGQNDWIAAQSLEVSELETGGNTNAVGDGSQDVEMGADRDSDVDAEMKEDYDYLEEEEDPADRNESLSNADIKQSADDADKECSGEDSDDEM